MSFELTREQSATISSEGENVVVIDPVTNQSYRLVRDDVFHHLQSAVLDDAVWSPGESAMLAGLAFSKLDDTDYSEYLDTP